MRLSFKKFGSPAIGPKRGSKKIGESWPFQKPRSTRHPGRVSSHPKTVNWVSEALSYVWAMMRVLQNSMLPAGCRLTLGTLADATSQHHDSFQRSAPTTDAVASRVVDGRCSTTARAIEIGMNARRRNLQHRSGHEVAWPARVGEP